MIMDLQVGCVHRDIYNVYYMRYVGGHLDSAQHFFNQKRNRCPDLDGDFPFYGVDEGGNYADPPDEDTLKEWAESHWKRYPKEYMWPTYHGAMFYKKLIQYCLACGLKREDLQAEFGGAQADKSVLAGDDGREKLQARSKALNDLERQSEFVRRLFKGTSCFRPDTEGMQNTLFIPSDEIFLAARENSRKLSAVYMVISHGIMLPDRVLQAYYQEMEKVKRSGNYFPLWGIHLHQDHIRALTEEPQSEVYRTTF